MKEDTNMSEGLRPVRVWQFPGEDVLRDIQLENCGEIYESVSQVVGEYQELADKVAGNSRRFVVVVMKSHCKTSEKICAKFLPEYQNTFNVIESLDDIPVIIGLMEREDAEYILMAFDSMTYEVLTSMENVPAVVIVDRTARAFPRQ